MADTQRVQDDSFNSSGPRFEHRLSPTVVDLNDLTSELSDSPEEWPQATEENVRPPYNVRHANPPLRDDPRPLWHAPKVDANDGNIGDCVA